MAFVVEDRGYSKTLVNLVAFISSIGCVFLGHVVDGRLWGIWHGTRTMEAWCTRCVHANWQLDIDDVPDWFRDKITSVRNLLKRGER